MVGWDRVCVSVCVCVVVVLGELQFMKQRLEELSCDEKKWC